MCSRLEQVSPWYQRGLSDRKRFHVSEEVFSWWNEEDWEGWFSSWQELHEMQQTPASYRRGWRWWLIIDMKRLLLSTSFAMMTYDWRWGLEHVWWHKGLSGPLPRCLITLSLMWTILWCGKGIPVGSSRPSRWTREHAAGAENLSPVAFWWARGGGQCEGVL